MEKTKLILKNPCAANWDSMTPNEQGRHCAHCHKTVVDFSTKTDPEILAYLSKSTGGNLCGRATDKQWNRSITVDNGHYRFPAALRKFAAVSLLGFATAGMPVLLNAQTITEPENAKVRVLDNGHKVLVVEVPAEYETIEVKELISPARIVVDHIPAEYKSVFGGRVLVRGGGFAEYKEITCILPREGITLEIKTLKEKLREKGYFDGVLDNQINDSVKEALIRFKKGHGQPPTFELDDHTAYLLGIIDDFPR